MTITNDPLVPGSPVQFKVTGFPEETAVRASVERFYGLKPDADKNFLINNAFNELIFSGAVGEDSKIAEFDFVERPEKSRPFNDKK